MPNESNINQTQPSLFSKCFNCNDPNAEIRRIHKFVKRYKEEWVEIRIFECQNCKDTSCKILTSNWRPPGE